MQPQIVLRKGLSFDGGPFKMKPEVPGGFDYRDLVYDMGTLGKMSVRDMEIYAGVNFDDVMNPNR